MNKRVNQLIIHILGCAVLLAFPLLFTPDISSPFDFINDLGFVRDLLFSVFLILFFYLSYYILVPRLYFNKKYFLFFSIAILSFFATRDRLREEALQRTSHLALQRSFWKSCAVCWRIHSIAGSLWNRPCQYWLMA